jgi:hypothetical protein
MRMLWKLGLTSLAFMFLLPLIPGIEFHGGFGTAFLMSLLFGFMLWLVDLLALLFATVFTITSWGLALLWLIPLWLLGCWLMPAFALKLLSDVAPSYLTINGFLPAVWAGLIMLVIGVLTSSKGKKEK